jgi:hypothetical protein
MTVRLSRALTALAVGSVAFSLAGAAQATTVQFASTVSFTESVNSLTFASSGLNTTLTVGTPLTIPQFISVTANQGADFNETNAPLTATFTFTLPTPTGTTTDSGTITGAQVNGRGANGTLSITWQPQPVEFDFTDGTKLDVTLGDLLVACTGNNCLTGTYHMTGTFLALSGPGEEIGPAATPLPAALPLFVSGLGGFGLLAWRRKRKNGA